MNKNLYHRRKLAYNLVINGCGNDCLTCEKEACICDDKHIQADAEAWAKQKECERQFYKNNREKRLNEAKEYHHKVVKPNKPVKDNMQFWREVFKALPESFTYDEAAKIWLVEKTCAVERIKRLIRFFPERIIKNARDGKKAVLFNKVSGV